MTESYLFDGRPVPSGPSQEVTLWQVYPSRASSYASSGGRASAENHPQLRAVAQARSGSALGARTPWFMSPLRRSRSFRIHRDRPPVRNRSGSSSPPAPRNPADDGYDEAFRRPSPPRTPPRTISRTPSAASRSPEASPADDSRGDVESGQ
eukprot:scaffold3148_cov275-Pinguiococcus_pyrenoidosus.AAC.5